MIRRSGLMALTLLCGCAAAGSGMTASLSRPPANAPARLLAVHNLERSRVQAPPLQWDPFLASAAASYGPVLARIGRLQHSPRAGRPGQRENLWKGPRGHYSPEQMVGGWIAERAMFRPGVFPHVSTTGNWSDVSHYTQLIWKGRPASAARSSPPVIGNI